MTDEFSGAGFLKNVVREKRTAKCKAGMHFWLSSVALCVKKLFLKIFSLKNAYPTELNKKKHLSYFMKYFESRISTQF
jgi:hypothetical protein